MKKDVIYIDIEDDITSVIEKLKASPEKIIALVPPKGNAVLQSVVNLKLLKRAADQVSKQPVIVTNNQALTALAGGLALYVAKNLQSKPELAGAAMADATANEDLNVNDADTASDGPIVHDNSSYATTSDDDEVELSGAELAGLQAENQASDPVPAPAKKPKKKGAKKVPNFDNFRKKLLIGGGIALLLIIAFVAVFGRARANVVLRADTTPVDVALEATFNSGASSSDPENFNLRAVSQQTKKTLSQGFSATGQKDIGQKATGTVRFSTGAISALGTTIPAGTRLTTNSGLAFVTTDSVTITISNYNNAPAGIAAAESGTKFNGASGQMSGAPSGISANITKSPSGGTTQVVRVVTQADVDKAKEALNQQDTNQARDDLKKQFSDDTFVLDDSFATTIGSVTSEPAVDQQANEGKLTAEVTYTLLGVKRSDLGAVLDAFVTTKMTNPDQQRVYDNGLENVRLERVDGNETSARFKVTTTAQYGPQFDIDELKEEVRGKKFGEARSYLQDLPGIKGVDMSLSPFWSRTLPGPERITIKLDVDKNALSQ